MGAICSEPDTEVVQQGFRRQVAEQKVGHYAWSCVWGYRSACLTAVRRAEAALGRPPYLIEIIPHWNSWIPMLSQFHLFVGLQDCFRNDEVLADVENLHFTLNPALQSTADNPTEYELFSDRFVKVFQGYVVDRRVRVRPGPDTPRVNFQWLKDVLLSKDLERNQELDWV